MGSRDSPFICRAVGAVNTLVTSLRLGDIHSMGLSTSIWVICQRMAGFQKMASKIARAADGVLQAARYAFIMPVIIRGRGVSDPRGPSATRVFGGQKHSVWANYTLRNSD
jgi:hypothetical protein